MVKRLGLKSKSLVFALVLLLLITSCFTTTPVFAATTKIACIGDSITEGFRTTIPSEYSYPAQLQSLLLQTGNVVANYGIGMRGMLKKGDYPYWNESFYTDSKNWQPNIVIIQLGTNDSKASDWIYKDEFVSDYVEFVNSYKNLASNPTVYICYPPACYETTGDFANSESVIVNEMIPMIDTVASQTGAIIIDNHTPTLNKRQFYADTLHPNNDGAFGIAYNVYKSLGAPGAKATFYKDINYGGTSVALPEGSYDYNQLLFTGFPNDSMSSIKVPSGYTVDVYKDAGFLGTKWTFTADSSSVGTANDQMSSVKIYKTGDIINRIQSYNFQTMYIRHANTTGRIDANVSPLEDSQWRIVPGLADPTCISFQSVNYPGFYLRHSSNNALVLQKDDASSTFAQDATFIKVDGLKDSTWSSFQSYNSPTMYIRHYNYVLYINTISTDLDKQDATFKVTN